MTSDEEEREGQKIDYQQLMERADKAYTVQQFRDLIKEMLDALHPGAAL